MTAPREVQGWSERNIGTRCPGCQVRSLELHFYDCPTAIELELPRKAAMRPRQLRAFVDQQLEARRQRR